MELLHNEITSTILKEFFAVANALRFGLDKTFYCKALNIELQSGLKMDIHRCEPVLYKDTKIGELSFDIVVNEVVIVQVITQNQAIEPSQIEMMKNHLRLTNFEVLLLLNFGIEPEHKRVFLSNDFKKSNI